MRLSVYQHSMAILHIKHFVILCNFCFQLFCSKYYKLELQGPLAPLFQNVAAQFFVFFLLFCLFCLFVFFVFLVFLVFLVLLSFLSFYLFFCLFVFFVMLFFCCFFPFFLFLFCLFLSFCLFLCLSVFLSFCLFVFLSFCHHYHNHWVNIYYHTNFCSNPTIFQFYHTFHHKPLPLLPPTHSPPPPLQCFLYLRETQANVLRGLQIFGGGGKDLATISEEEEQEEQEY